MSKRYRTDRYGSIDSFDIVHALRRAERRSLERRRREREREIRRERSWWRLALARLRAVRVRRAAA